MCNKVPYKTKKDAMNDAKLMRASSKHFKKNKSAKDSKKFRPYYCRYCYNWHLTTQKIRNKKGAKNG